MWLRITPYALRIAIQDAAVSLLAYLAGFYFTQLAYGTASHIGALWLMIRGIAVLQATRRDTLATAWLRVLGTFFGAVNSAAYLYLQPVQVEICKLTARAGASAEGLYYLSIL